MRVSALLATGATAVLVACVGMGSYAPMPVAASSTSQVPVGPDAASAGPPPDTTDTTQPQPSGESSPVFSPWARAGIDDSGVVAGAGGALVGAGSDDGGGGGGSGGSSQQREFDCLVIELDPETEGVGSVTPGLRSYDVEQASDLIEGNRYYQECWYLDTGDLFFADVWDQGPPSDPGVNARILAQSALSRTAFTVPEPQMAPAVDGEQITGLPTWIWLDRTTWEPVVAQAEAAGVTATVTATPERVEWDMGDGTTVVCDGPGTAWNFDGPNPDSSDCSHVFQLSSADEPDGRYSGSVTIVWSIAWEATTGESGVFAEGRSSSPLSLAVTELQAVVNYHP